MTDSSTELRSPQRARSLFDGLSAVHNAHLREKEAKSKEQEAVAKTIERAPKVEQALQILSNKMFEDVVHVIEEKLTIALQEVLEQPICLRADVGYKHRGVTVEFHIERDGKEEDIMKGQGGSVANILSVGLRMFALATLDPAQHRRFLVLDEQDCWLRPELVPKLVKIVREACDALGFQVLMISHHDPRWFQDYADRQYELTPQADGHVEVHMLRGPADEDLEL